MEHGWLTFHICFSLAGLAFLRVIWHWVKDNLM